VHRLRPSPEIETLAESILAKTAALKSIRLQNHALPPVSSTINSLTMSVAPGTKLGPYEIHAAIGAGGMGEVYRATDTKLKREVAVKVLPPAVANDPDRRARFRREAETLAALNHPNIAHIYGIEENALVMELVEGQMLKGPLPAASVINYAIQIAEALEAAHEKGIIHRDLKPANIMITSSGVIKVLDFGLAAVSTSPTTDVNSPTRTLRASDDGLILGTAAYMSPEQAAGKHVDKRSDIWSYGAVLFELLTGKKLFQDETVSETLADVLRAPIDLSELPGGKIKRLIQRCLDRNLKTRLQDIAEARIALTEPELNTPQYSRPTKWIIATVAAIAIAMATIAISFREPAKPAATSHVFELQPPDRGSILSVAISPDGRHFVAPIAQDKGPQLHIRASNRNEFVPLKGTEGASYPFWSPDSRWIGFFADGKLKKIPRDGGPAVTLCDASNGRGGTWNRNGVIVYSPAPFVDLRRTTADGGGCPVVLKLGTNFSYRFPSFLPDGNRFLLTVESKEFGPQVGRLQVSSLTDPTLRTVIPEYSSGFWAPSSNPEAGHILFQREFNLMAQKFKWPTLEAEGDAEVISDSIQVSNVAYTQVSASRDGTVVFHARRSLGPRQLTWHDRTGKILENVGPPDVHGAWSLSPDAKFLVKAKYVNSLTNLWIRDLSRNVESRLTYQYANTSVWARDGKSLVYSGGDVSQGSLFIKPLSGENNETPLVPTRGLKTPFDWSRDGKYFLYSELGETTRADIWIVEDPTGQQIRRPFINGPYDEFQAQFSPDDRWVAYTSTESGVREVYVRPFPNGTSKWKVSTAGGQFPRWRRDGKELFFLSLDNHLHAVEITGQPGNEATFQTSPPKELFLTNAPGTGSHGLNADYVVSADGQKFLIDHPTSNPPEAPLRVITNWVPAAPGK